MDEPTPFEVEVQRPFDHVVVLELEGEVDIHSASLFKGALFEAIDLGTSRVIIDFTKVTFIDSTALGVVVSGVKGIKARGGAIDVVCPKENISTIFVATGLDRILGIHRSRAQALAGAEGAKA
jgi:anti-sigma B factor antagonist